MVENPEFRKELEFKRDILETIDYQGDLRLKKMLQEEEELVESPISLEKAQNNYSLSADIATGWRPKMKIIGPMPLNFDN